MEKKTFRALETRAVIIVYGILLLVCLLSDFGRFGSITGSWKNSQNLGVLGWFIGLLLIVFYVVASHFMSKFFRWAIELEKAFRQILTPLSYFQMVLLAILSGVLEEWFFRGILLPHFGLMISSIAFGLAHFIPAPRLWVWSLWSFFVGIVFGLLMQATGSLYLVAFIHGAINGVLLYSLNIRGHSAPALT